MFDFLIPLVVGFTFNVLSAFTTTYSQWWGRRYGTLFTTLLRAVLGIPLWTTGFALAVLTIGPALLPSTSLTQIAGIVCLSMGSIIIYMAFQTMRTPALAPSIQDRLIQTGIYAYVRHPMDVGAILVFLGITLLKPTQAVSAAAATGFAWALIQAWAEEQDLLRRVPGYKAYMSQVPRFVPHLQRDHARASRTDEELNDRNSS